MPFVYDSVTGRFRSDPPLRWDYNDAIRKTPDFGAMTNVEQNDALNRHHDLFQETAMKVAREEIALVERAACGWAEQCGVTVEEWAKFYGVKTKRTFEGDGETMQVKIAVQPVPLRKPPESWPARGVVLPA